MVRELRFNICKLEDSRRFNADFEDPPYRIKEIYIRRFAVQCSLLVKSFLLYPQAREFNVVVLSLSPNLRDDS